MSNENAVELSRSASKNDDHHQAVLQQFCEVTGHQNTKDAESLLESCNWSLEHAIAVYYEHHDQYNKAPNEYTARAVTGQPAVNENRGVRDGTSQCVQPLLENNVIEPSTFHTWLLNNFRLLGSQLMAVSSSLVSLFRLFCSSLSNAATPPNIETYNKYFHDKYGEVGPVFTNESFHQSYQRASREKRVLIVYLDHPTSTYTQYIARIVLQNTQFLELIEANNVIVWGSHVDKAEAVLLIRHRLVPCSLFPHLSIFVFPPATASTNDSILYPNLFSASIELNWNLVGSIEGHVESAEHAICLLTMAIEKSITFEEYQTRQMTQVEADRRLREEQDRAYREALKRDLERDKQRNAEKQRLSEEEARIREQREQKIALEKQLQKNRQERLKLYFKKLVNMHGHLPLILFRIRFSDGKFLDCSFSAEQHTMIDIFDWVDSIACIKDTVKQMPELSSESVDTQLSYVLKQLSDLCDFAVTKEQLSQWCGSFDAIMELPDIPDNYALIPSMDLHAAKTRSSSDPNTVLSALGFQHQVLLFVQPHDIGIS